MLKNKVVAIDFDGTIVDNDFPRIGKLKEGAKETINLIGNYNTVCIWTCRTGEARKEAINFLQDNEINFHYFNESPLDDNYNEVSRKIQADIYIDDKNIFTRVIEWAQIKEYFESFIDKNKIGMYSMKMYRRTIKR